MTISEWDKTNIGINQNIQLTRFLAAVFVIFSHGYSLSLGDNSLEPLMVLTKGSLQLASVSVAVFFMLAGMFSVKSLDKADRISSFLIRRLKRLWCPLIAVVIASVILGGLITDIGISRYCLDYRTWLYLLNGLFIPIHSLPGVFTANPYGNVVNGALWTLPVELVCYVVCALFKRLDLFKKNKFKYTAIPALGLFVLSFVFIARFPMLVAVVRPCLFFYIGMGVYVYKDTITPSSSLGILSLLIFASITIVADRFCGGYANLVINAALLICLPIMLLSVWFCDKQIKPWLGQLGDCSYGMYLTGFVIEQVILGMAQVSFVLGLVISIVIAVLLGLLVNRTIEKRVK